MQQKLYRVEEDASISLQSIEDVSPDWIRDETMRWLAIEAAEPDDVVAALTSLKLDSLIVEALREEHDGPRMAVYDRNVLISIPFYLDGSSPPEYLTILSLPTTLITFTVNSNLVLQRLGTELTSSQCLVEPTAAALLYSIVDALGDGNRGRVLACRRKIAGMAEQIEKDPSSVNLGDILENKRIVDELLSTIEDQLYCTGALINLKVNEFSASTMQQYFRDTHGLLGVAHRAVLRLESRVQDLHQHYLLTLQDSTNRRLNVLTILSAIYLPATLIAGIYGMNFSDIPAVALPHGFFIVLGIMVIVIAGQFLYFVKKGWFA